MAAEQSFDVGAVALIHRLQARDRLASSHNGEALATVLHGVKKVGEAPCRFGRCDLRHEDQIIRYQDRRAEGLLSDRPAWVPEAGGLDGWRDERSAAGHGAS